MAYNTGNPIGSSDPRDLADNALALDRALNDTALSFTDRLGQQRMTLAGMEQAATGVQAVEASIAAIAAKEAAELAKEASLIQAGVYVDEPTGRAAVADGQAFKVQGSGSVAAYEYRRVNSSSSTLIATYPSIASITASNSEAANVRQEITDAGGLKYAGSGPKYPIVVDQQNKIVLGYDQSAGAIFGDGLLTSDSLTQKTDQLIERTDDMILSSGVISYTGSGPVIPILADIDNRILLGFDIVSGLLFGPGLANSSSVDERPIPKAINHMLFYGQSLSVGATATDLLSTAQPYSNITFNGGPRAWSGAAYDFSAFKSLVEDAVSPAPDGGTNRGETSCSGAANYATTLAVLDGKAPSDHIILASTAGHGGYRIDQLNKGSSWYASALLPHISGAKALNSDYALHAFCWAQGENDAVSGTHTAYATYRAALEQLQADIEADAKSISGQISPVYCITYQMSYAAATWPDQAKAQLDLAQKNPRFALATPCYHLPFATDNIHLTNVGYKWMGAYFGRAYKQLVMDGKKPEFLNPLSATRRDNVIRVKFDVPTLPLVIDTTTLAPTANQGFKVLDGASPATINSIAVDGADVVITLASAPTGTVKVRYALDYLGTGLTITGGASGNLRDSTTDVITISGVSRPLYHVAPHFELTAFALGE